MKIKELLKVKYKKETRLNSAGLFCRIHLISRPGGN